MNGTKEQEVKNEMSVRELPDSFELAMGTPSKGSAIKLKAYFDVADIDKAQVKVENILKIREYLAGKGFV